MSTDYEPGTVAVATVRGVEGVRVIRAASFGHGYWIAPEWEADKICEDSVVTGVRPLVVLDLDAHLTKHWSSKQSLICSLKGHGYHGLAAIFEQAQTKPRRISEPGLWGVVEATRIDPMSTGETCEGKWFRTESKILPWTHESGSFTADWDDLIDPTLIREGLS